MKILSLYFVCGSQIYFCCCCITMQPTTPKRCRSFISEVNAITLSCKQQIAEGEKDTAKNIFFFLAGYLENCLRFPCQLLSMNKCHEALSIVRNKDRESLGGEKGVGWRQGRQGQQRCIGHLFYILELLLYGNGLLIFYFN